VVTHQLQVERRTGKVRRPETDVLPLSHATNINIVNREVEEREGREGREGVERDGKGKGKGGEGGGR